MIFGYFLKLPSFSIIKFIITCENFWDIVVMPNVEFEFDRSSWAITPLMHTSVSEAYICYEQAQHKIIKMICFYRSHLSVLSYKELKIEIYIINFFARKKLIFCHLFLRSWSCQKLAYKAFKWKLCERKEAKRKTCTKIILNWHIPRMVNWWWN